jgi:hypothetical protein
MFKSTIILIVAALVFLPYSNHGGFGREMDRRKLILGYGGQAKSNDTEEGLHA